MKKEEQKFQELKSKIQKTKIADYPKVEQVTMENLSKPKKGETLESRKRRLEELRTNAKGKENNELPKIEVKSKVKPMKDQNKLLEKLFYN